MSEIELLQKTISRLKNELAEWDKQTPEQLSSFADLLDKRGCKNAGEYKQIMAKERAGEFMQRYKRVKIK
jgi:hypothetical protein